MGFLDRFVQGTPPASPAEADLLALRHLEGRGADLTQPRHVIHFLYFADEAAAQRAADSIGRASYDTTVHPPHDGIQEWSVRAEGSRVVGATTVEGFRAWFEHVADEFAGEYNGWEAAAKP